MRKLILPRLAVPLAAVLLTATAVAQNPIFALPPGFLRGYEAQRQLNEESTLRQLQQLRLLLEMKQQVDQQNEQRRRTEQEMQIMRQQQAIQEQQRQMQIAEIQTAARLSIADHSKGACIDMFLKDTSATAILGNKGTTVGQFCGCVEQELISLMTLDLAGRLLLASNEFGGDGQRFAASPVGQEYAARFAASFKGCADQMNARAR